MRPYDPDRGPDVEDWLDADEQERIDAVRRHHKKTRERIPSLLGHAVIHAIVETQLATREAAVQQAFDRLRAEGLDRHDTIHAIGWVLANVFESVMKREASISTVAPNEAYTKALEVLSAEAWRRAT